jgi:uncharacterized protein (DUF433 family)
MNYHDRIIINPSIRSGKPCIVNTRIAVADIFDYLGGGMSIEEIVDDFPDLTKADIQACFSFTAVGVGGASTLIEASPSGESRSTINCHPL